MEGVEAEEMLHFKQEARGLGGVTLELLQQLYLKNYQMTTQSYLTPARAMF